MRKLVLALAGAAALTMGSTSANAATIFDVIDSATLDLAGTESFGAIIVNEDGVFAHTFEFNLTDDFLTNSQVSSILLDSIDIDFSSILLDGFAFIQTGFDPAAEVWELDPAVVLGAGPHTIFVNGSVVGASEDGSYVGTLNISPPAVVPEPATWAMMLLGFAAVGYQMRKRRPNVQLQLA